MQIQGAWLPMASKEIHSEATGWQLCSTFTVNTPARAFMCISLDAHRNRKGVHYVLLYCCDAMLNTYDKHNGLRLVY